MRIAAIELIEYRAAFERPEGNGVTLWTERRAALVRLTTRDGISGIGEAWSPANDVDPVLASLRRHGASRIGADIDDDDAAAGIPDAQPWPDTAAAGAIDMAIADARARARGLPLWALLGGRHAPPRVAVYGSGGLYAPWKSTADLAAELGAAAASGFSTVKMKVGALPLDADLARIRAVRDAIGPAQLVVDALASLPPAEAVTRIARFAEAGAAAVQAPLPVENPGRLQALAEAAAVPVWIGEASAATELFDVLAATRGRALVQLNPARVGGPTALGALVARYRRTPPIVTLQCHATAVLQAASLHLGAGLDGIAHCEFHLFHRHLHERLPASMRAPRAGFVHPGDEPGLGVTLPDHDPRLRLVTRIEA